MYCATKAACTLKRRPPHKRQDLPWGPCPFSNFWLKHKNSLPHISLPTSITSSPPTNLDLEQSTSTQPNPPPDDAIDQASDLSTSTVAASTSRLRYGQHGGHHQQQHGPVSSSSLLVPLLACLSLSLPLCGLPHGAAGACPPPITSPQPIPLRLATSSSRCSPRPPPSDKDNELVTGPTMTRTTSPSPPPPCLPTRPSRTATAPRRSSRTASTTRARPSRRRAASVSSPTARS